MSIRTQLFSCNHVQDAHAEIDRLCALYLKTFKRALTVELHLFDVGAGRDRQFGITVYSEASNLNHPGELGWLQGAVTQ